METPTTVTQIHVSTHAWATRIQTGRGNQFTCNVFDDLLLEKYDWFRAVLYGEDDANEVTRGIWKKHAHLFLHDPATFASGPDVSNYLSEWFPNKHRRAEYQGTIGGNPSMRLRLAKELLSLPDEDLLVTFTP